MRQWTPSCSSHSVQVLQGLIGLMGQSAFETSLLEHLQPLVPAASYSVSYTHSDAADDVAGV
jgi:hypothetical protein